MIPADQWASAWCSESVTLLQARAAEADLERWLAGAPHASFDPFRTLIKSIINKFETFLEIGAGSCYYKAALKHIDPRKYYTGCDISPAMIHYAQEKWGGDLIIADSASIPSEDETWDVACISGLIQHLPDYRPSIKEAARVAKKFVILHRCEIVEGECIEFVRDAYGVKIPTRKVDEDSLLFYCGTQGLRFEKRVKWDAPAGYSASFLLEKMP